MSDLEVQPHTAEIDDRAPKGGAMQIPYGLRDGRMLGPEAVARGLACNCVCPACHGPLVAKQGESGRRRPHFAHHVGADCHAGFETSLHLKAKEILVEAGWLWLPGWVGDEGMLNPPMISSKFGKVFTGQPVSWREARVDLRSAKAAVDSEEGARRRVLEEASAKALAEGQQRKARFDEAKRRVRAQYAEELTLLAEFAEPSTIPERLQAFKTRDRREAMDLLASFADPRLADILMASHLDAWVYEADPVLWQSAVFQEFVAGRDPGFVIKQPDVARWVTRNFGIESAMQRLFRAQYEARTSARRAGYEAWRLAHWAFSDLENALIPNCYKPINWLMDRLVVAGYLGMQAKGRDLVVLQRGNSA